MARRTSLLFLLLAAGCGGEAATQITFDPSATSFWAVPLPSEHRQAADSPFALPRWPGEWRPNDLVEMWLAGTQRAIQGGWGVSGGVFLTTTAPIDPATLPADPPASLEPSASVFLVDIDPRSPELGRRFPLEVSFRAERDLYTPGNLLAAVPVFGFVRRPNTRYALLVTDDVRDSAGAPIGPSEALGEALEPVADTLESLGIDRDRLAGAAVFTTFDQNATLQKLVAWAESQPAPTLTASIGVSREYSSYLALRTRFEVPVIQNGSRPYGKIGEGLITYDGAGDPEVRERQTVDIVLTLPKTPQPSGGYPLTVYLHGSGGERFEVIERGPVPEVADPGEADPTHGTGPAEWLAREGVATLAIDFPLHGSRFDPPDTSGLVFYNLFGNIEATIDNFHVAVMELTILSRLIPAITIDPSIAPGRLDAGADPSGQIHFAPERLTAMGQSMGTTLGIAWATVDPRVKGFLFSGAGGILVDIAVEAHEPVPLKPVLEGFIGLTERGETLDLAHPLLHTFENLWDRVDTIAKAPYISALPHPGLSPRQVMMTAGFRDGYFAPKSQAALAVALGASLVGDEVEPILADTLRLAGRSTVPYPLAGNLAGHTVGVIQRAAPHELGHYVVFNQEGARHQYTCFLSSVGVKEPPPIVAPEALDAPCP
ncbi:MAG: hypothetical protein IT384_12185 [Deltaproteobacteria bacterium]|nr:hypothetical protein [Deltaproteobacteria bacterium]